MLVIVNVDREEEVNELVRALQVSGHDPTTAGSADELLAALGLEPVNMDHVNLDEFDVWTQRLYSILDHVRPGSGDSARAQIIQALALTSIARTLARGLPPIA